MGRPPTGVVLRGGPPCCKALLGGRSSIGLGFDVDTRMAGDTRTPATGERGAPSSPGSLILRLLATPLMGLGGHSMLRALGVSSRCIGVPDTIAATSASASTSAIAAAVAARSITAATSASTSPAWCMMDATSASASAANCCTIAETVARARALGTLSPEYDATPPCRALSLRDGALPADTAATPDREDERFC